MTDIGALAKVNVTINGVEATCEVTGTLTAGMVGVPVSFTFGPEWEGLVITAVFRNGGCIKDVELPDDNQTMMPYEVLRQPSYTLYIGAEGRTKTGEVVIPTTWACVGRLQPGATASGNPALMPTPSQYDRIMAAIKEAREESVDEDRLPDSVLMLGENLNEQEQTQAREMIGAVGRGDIDSLERKIRENYLSPKVPQTFTTEQQTQARENIGAAAAADTVRITAQKLTEEQKAQARENIGAVKTVNGQEPDKNGNVQIETGGVKSVNGNTPNENGNVQVDIPLSNWNTVEGGKGHILNRTHYVQYTGDTDPVVPQVDATPTKNPTGFDIQTDFQLELERYYRVIYNGISRWMYPTYLTSADTGEIVPVLGSIDDEYPFLIVPPWDGRRGFVGVNDGATSVNIAIYVAQEKVKKLHKKYLPDEALCIGKELTAEQQTAAQEMLGIGDLNTALDSILAMQEALIGGESA